MSNYSTGGNTGRGGPFRARRPLLVAAAFGLSMAAEHSAASRSPAHEAVVSVPRSIAWTGKAQVQAGSRQIDIGVSTEIEPFGNIRSDSWLLSEGPSSTRSMIIDPASGWMDRGHGREPMPAAMLAHERQQYGVYTLMLLAPALARNGQRQIVIEGLGAAPRTELGFDKAGRLAWARNRVVDPEGGPRVIRQEFRFTGDMVSAKVHWPRRIEILQDGKPYFRLDIDTLRVER